jgi:hypothetical protein
MEKTQNHPLYIVHSVEIIRIKVKGNKEDLKDFARMLEKSKITFYPARKSSVEVGRRRRNYPVPTQYYYHRKTNSTRMARQLNFALFPSLIPDAFAAIASVLVIEITKEAARAILDWLKKRKREKRNPKLKVTVNGKTVKLTSRQVEAIYRMLMESEKPSRKTKTHSSGINRGLRHTK